ncbi:hypothetical protein J437_LFUL002338 [Ladona fulva]|uniref:Uncharacterized protein n=1 Tax=Ladona fulva TaxID=123851 RepID=A0A8K0K849_LADFU|nr:hypothetical protein J437_LFUL002338 [Ladona fulva]
MYRFSDCSTKFCPISLSRQDGKKQSLLLFLKLVPNRVPISILLTFSKVFEKLLHDKPFPDCMKSFSENQENQSRRSTTTNLMVHTNYVTSSILLGLQIDPIYINFAKVFDKVFFMVS